jgi:predicted RNase H-like HicB family nuclease
MFTEYVLAAMKRAEYEIIPEDSLFFGHIPGFVGVWAAEKTLEATRMELQSVLEDWLILKLWDHDNDIPVLGRLYVTPIKPKRAKREPNIETRARKAS